MKPKPEYYKKKKLLNKKVVQNILDQCSEIGVKSVQFNGQDEPTIYPDLVEIIQHASLKGFDDIYFNTNGSKLSPALSQALVDAGLTKIQISIDAFSQATYKQVRKKEGMGLGDAKLLAVVGFWFGWVSIPFVLFCSSISILSTISPNKYWVSPDSLISTFLSI